MRRILLLPLLAVALVGFVKGQSTNEKKEDAVGGVEQKEVLIKEAQAFADHIEDVKRSGDRKALEGLYSDDFISKDERFGIGEVLHKTQYLERRGSVGHGSENQVIKHAHSDVRLLVFGSTVVMTGYSTSILRHKGRLSKGPRLFTFIYVKQDGRWQAVAEDVFDIPKGYEEPQ